MSLFGPCHPNIPHPKCWSDADPLDADAWQAEVEALRRYLEAAKAMAHAENWADRFDFVMAADTMAHSEFVKQVDLFDLAKSMADGGASRGDWDGFRVYFWRAWLAALAKELK